MCTRLQAKAFRSPELKARGKCMMVETFFHDLFRAIFRVAQATVCIAAILMGRRTCRIWGRSHVSSSTYS